MNYAIERLWLHNGRFFGMAVEWTIVKSVRFRRCLERRPGGCFAARNFQPPCKTFEQLQLHCQRMRLQAVRVTHLISLFLLVKFHFANNCPSLRRAASARRAKDGAAGLTLEDSQEYSDHQGEHINLYLTKAKLPANASNEDETSPRLCNQSPVICALL